MVFDDGDVVNIKTGRIMKQGDNGNHSLHVYLTNAKGGRTHQVRKLVADAFLDPRPSPRHVLTHLDGDYTNCSAENLTWDTRSAIQFRRVLREEGQRSEVRRVRIKETGDVYDNIFECAKVLDGDPRLIHRTTLNSNWEYLGYTFEYL